MNQCLQLRTLVLSVTLFLITSLYSSLSAAQTTGEEYAPHCITVKLLKLEDYWEEKRAVLVNTCNRPVWAAYCNVGASKKQAGCGTGSQYYRQRTYLKANEKYYNQYNILKEFSQKWAECPSTEDRDGGFEVLNSDGSYRCEGSSQYIVKETEQHFSCSDVPGTGASRATVIVKETIPGILSVKGPGSTVNLNLSRFFSKSGEAKKLTGDQFTSMQNSLVKAMAQACTGKDVEGNDTSGFESAGESMLNWFGNCEADDIDCKNRTFSGKSRVTGWGVRG